MSNKSKSFFAFPEMRAFWLFLIFGSIVLIIDVIYSPSLWILIAAGIFLVIGLIIFFSSLKLARSNFEIKIERSQIESVISNIRDGVIAYDQDFKILIFNPAA